MKKFVSVIATIAMLIGTTANVFAAKPTAENPSTVSVTASATKIDFSKSEFSSYKDDYDWSGYNDENDGLKFESYMITVDIKGIELEQKKVVDGRSYYFTGESIITHQLQTSLTIPDGLTENYDYKYGTVYKLGTVSGSFGSGESNMGAAGVSPIYPVSPKNNDNTCVSVEKTDAIPMYKFIVTVDTSKKIKFKLTGDAKLGVGIFDAVSKGYDANPTGSYEYKPASTIVNSTTEFPLTVDTTEITLPLAETTKVSSITVNANDTMVKGTKQTATATVLPADATNKNVTWSITDGTDKASIDETTGEITATGAGTITIKATAADGSGVSGTKTITITEPETKPQVTVTEDSKKGHDGNVWAWLLTITGHKADYNYKGTFKATGESDNNVDLNVDGISGAATFNKIILLETDKADPQFTAEAVK